jgi:ParB/RepB/Spo0J family partition protein
MKIVAGDVARQDMISVFPENVIVVPEENGRLIPATEEEVKLKAQKVATLAESIKKDGQKQPVLVRRVEGNKIQLVAGYTRHAAITLLNTQQPDDPLRIQCKVVDMSPEEAFVSNLIENLQRDDTTPMDDAHNQRRLRDQYGWSEQKIADFYKNSVAYIGQLRKTLQLPEAIQQGVQAKTVPLQAALDLTELPAAEAVTVVAAATNPETGKVDATKVRQHVRNKRIEAGKGQGKARSMKEVRTFFEETTGPGEAEGVRELAKKVLSFIEGKITDQQMTNALNKWAGDKKAA